jgi:hypothetical protein
LNCSEGCCGLRFSNANCLSARVRMPGGRALWSFPEIRGGAVDHYATD